MTLDTVLLGTGFTVWSLIILLVAFAATLAFCLAFTMAVKELPVYVWRWIKNADQFIIKKGDLLTYYTKSLILLHSHRLSIVAVLGPHDLEASPALDRSALKKALVLLEELDTNRPARINTDYARINQIAQRFHAEHSARLAREDAEIS